jgi:hypothetical protein
VKDRLRYAVVGLVAAVIAANASAQSLGDVAKRERERRAKLQAEKAKKGDRADTPVKTYTESDLQNVRGENFTQATGPVVDWSTSVPSSSNSVFGRSDSAASRPGASGGSVAALEQRVRDLERQRAALPPGPFGASVACVTGVRVRSTNSAIQLRDSPPTQVCNTNILLQQEAQRVQAQLDQARAALEQARR